MVRVSDKTIVSTLQRFNRAYDRDDFSTALPLIESLSRHDPDDHWYWSRLSSVQYELRDYESALESAQQALRLSPRCPLAIWDCAGALDMLGKESEAILYWKKLLKRSIASIAYGDCGEGMRSAMSLINDSRYKIASCYVDLGKRKLAIKYASDHLAHRQKGLQSIVSKREVQLLMRNLNTRTEIG